MQDKKLSLFDHLNIITMDKRELTEDELSSYSPYQINRFVSMVDQYLPVVNEINLYDVPKDVHHLFMRSFLPKRKQYFNYIKNNKKEEPFESECIQKYFECGTNDVDEIINILNADELEFIISKFRDIRGNANARKKRKGR